jgi:PTS system galactitol-specific IIC component
MDVIVKALQYIAALGPMVMMPLVLLVIGLILRVKFSTLFRSSLLVGVGFAGINTLIGFFVGGVGPAIQQMVTTWGLRTDIMDVGWPARAAATWAFPMAAIVILVVLGVNIIALFLKWTRCVMVDFWSYNHFVFTAALIWYITKSPVLAILGAALDALISFKLADLTAPLAESYFGLPNISFPTSNSMSWVPIAWGMEKIYQLIPGFRDLKADPEYIQKKLGILGDPLFMGIVLGAAIAVLGRQSFKDILVVAMTTAASMVLIPRMMQILMEGLLPFADAIRDILQARFQGANFTIGVDAALTMANSSAISVGILAIPSTLVLAAILPGNRILPLPDLAVASIWLAAWPVAFAKGNIVRGYITTMVCIAIMLLIATDMAPIQTQLAVAGGFSLPEGMTVIGSQDSGLHLIGWLISKLLGIFA